MVRVFLAAILLIAQATFALAQQERPRLGYGRLLTNDALGDNLDRWRTGSVASSRVWGPAWAGRPPATFGELIELRLGAEVISPAALVRPDPRDRPYAGILSAGLHTHFAHGETDMSLGLDLALTGPATQLDALQSGVHDLLNVSPPSDLVLDAQIGNGLHPTVVFEAGRDLDLTGALVIRPFIEARAGLETFARAGFDLTLGAQAEGELLVRDPATGHRYRVIRQDWAGTQFLFGADIAHVTRSVLLPAASGVTPEKTRHRLRAGLRWQGKNGASVFYGATYLSEEFTAQPEGQVLGSIRVHWRF